jgi:hypothetical protein
MRPQQRHLHDFLSQFGTTGQTNGKPLGCGEVFEDQPVKGFPVHSHLPAKATRFALCPA